MAETKTDLLVERRREAYLLRQQVVALTHQVYSLDKTDKIAQLTNAQDALAAVEIAISHEEAAIQQAKEVPVVTATTKPAQVTRGLETTKIEVEIRPRMAYIPTAYYHLLDVEVDPLVECCIRTTDRNIKRLRITAHIEGYTARAVKTVEIKQDKPERITMLPTFFPERVRQVNELTGATLNVLAEDLDKDNRVEIHETRPVWLLSRNSATFEVNDPTNPEPDKRLKDFRPYLGAFVTPNHPSVQRFLTEVASKHIEKQLKGELGNPTAQAEAIFTALKESANIVYVNAPIAFNPSKGAIGQRVRLPYECLHEKQANCLDGALLFASLLEALGLNAAIVLIPSHAMVGWAVDDQNTSWRYVDTTLIGTHDFYAAMDQATARLARYQPTSANGDGETANGEKPLAGLHLLELSALRGRGVTPIA